MDLLPIRTPALGDTSYLLSHAGYGIVVDPQRDLDRFEHAIEQTGVQLTHVLETHIHNDYVSGGRELARRTGADLVLPAAAGVAFPHVMAFHGEELEAAEELSIRPLHTPGHTPEHTSYLVLLEDVPVAVFSGGSLLVLSAGRTDLLGDELAHELARAQFASVHRLAALPETVELLPTHGQGSFCTATSAGSTTSTIGAERSQNPALSHPDAESFARAHLSGLQPYPSYYSNMGPINRSGPGPMPEVHPRELTRRDVERVAADGVVIDARPRHRFAAGHIPGSLGIEAGEAFASWVGWLAPFDAPIALVIDDEDPKELATELGRIGFDHVEGYVRDLALWGSNELESVRLVDLAAFARAAAEPQGYKVLDVRSPGEWERRHIPGSLHRYVPDLRTDERFGFQPRDEVWVVCESGFRSMIAAGLLERKGLVPIVLNRGGVSDVLAMPAFDRSKT